ncbi:MAG: hypothetical protein ABSF25_23520 [Bryobacteraceae bacterium]|jgi:uncharacterized DUF497 family protein
MDVEWDPAKARLNAGKHGVLLADAVAALEMRAPGPYAILSPMKKSGG